MSHVRVDIIKAGCDIAFWDGFSKAGNLWLHFVSVFIVTEEDLLIIQTKRVCFSHHIGSGFCILKSVLVG